VDEPLKTKKRVINKMKMTQLTSVDQGRYDFEKKTPPLSKTKKVHLTSKLLDE